MDQKTPLHQIAAELLAHAAVDLFPNTLLLGGRGTSRYFYYDLLFPFPFHKETLSMIEECMIRMFKERPQIKKREMLASNAAELFISRSQPLLAEMLQEIPGLVSICEIKDFLDFCPYLFSSHWPSTLHIKLFDADHISSQEHSITRIIGAVSEDKQTLKTLLKAPSPISLKHTRFAIEEKLFLSQDDGHWIWQPKGEVMKQLLLQRWRSLIAAEGFATISTLCPLYTDPEASLLRMHRECHLKSNVNKLAEIAYFPHAIEGDASEGLFHTKMGFSDRLIQFSSEENFLQTCISSLRFILEMPKILGFEFQLTLGGFSTGKRAQGSKKEHSKLNGRRIFQTALERSGLNYTVEHDAADEDRSAYEAWIEVKLPDALGRLWRGPFMSIPAQAQTPMLVCSVFGTMERLVGLILERYAGMLPMWLAPEQVRLILISEEARCYTERVHRTLEHEGIRSIVDDHSADLKSRLYQAIAEKIPFAVIIGNREWQAENLVVRTLGSQQEERMNVDALCNRIRCESNRINEEKRL